MGHVLHVCTANQIRSAMAERLMRAALLARHGTGAADLIVASAGVQAWNGAPMFPEALDELRRRGIDAADFRSTVIDPEVVGGARLVLVATRWHRDMVLAVAPGAAEYVFTWQEAAWLLADADRADIVGDTLPERVAGLAALAARRRATLGPAPDAVDVVDPIGGPVEGYRRAADEIDAALGPVVALL
ncbi:low molecular weight phosphatase family protein [Luedemannella helvata]|uniref:Phosphotyrosine protein phosphatase I domain-containing protein n=1 Tax=Luedemannella helvata TaxID=349315 RepID=A0ABN2KN22_9ACTN